MDKGQDKISRICNELRYQTLEPAKLEAEKIIAEALERSEQIIAEAKTNAKNIVEESRILIERERNVFNSSLAQASEQILESLRQKIEQEFFNSNLQELIVDATSAPKVIGRLINAIVENIKNEGLSKDFTAVIPRTSSAEEIARCLGEDVLAKLRNNPLLLGNFEGGAQVKLLDKKLTLVLTDKELIEFLKLYVRKDFRKFIFAPEMSSDMLDACRN
ncbi:MAG: V-type ATP synthase subunit E [Parachlamydiaceae bacterium]|nr:V-type ATP synthase subunit E [Parachlamydiaceae bacterium]